MRSWGGSVVTQLAKLPLANPPTYYIGDIAVPFATQLSAGRSRKAADDGSRTMASANHMGDQDRAVGP